MTLAEAKFLHAYNAWADNRILEALALVPAEKYMRDMKSSYGGIHGTLVHIVSAQKVWLERFRGLPQVFLSAEAVKSLAEVKAIWEMVGYETAKWLGTMTDKKLADAFTFTTVKGETITHVFAIAFNHVVNHSSYHRGQIITMLRQLDEKPVSTDLSLFYRETTKATSR
jgi:uncharacterized damage-inducible protein DinB